MQQQIPLIITKVSTIYQTTKYSNIQQIISMDIKLIMINVTEILSAVMAANNSALPSQGINYILKYINIQKTHFKNCNNISQHYATVACFHEHKTFKKYSYLPYHKPLNISVNKIIIQHLNALQLKTMISVKRRAIRPGLREEKKTFEAFVEEHLKTDETILQHEIQVWAVFKK